MKKILKLSVRNVRDADNHNSGEFVPVNDTDVPVSSKVKHLHINLIFFFSIVH